MIKNLFKRAGIPVGGVLLSASGVAFAAPDVADVVTEIGGASAPIAAIGSAVLMVMVGIKVFKWVRAAM